MDTTKKTKKKKKFILIDVKVWNNGHVSKLLCSVWTINLIFRWLTGEATCVSFFMAFQSKFPIFFVFFQQAVIQFCANNISGKNFVNVWYFKKDDDIIVWRFQQKYRNLSLNKRQRKKREKWLKIVEVENLFQFLFLFWFPDLYSTANGNLRHRTTKLAVSGKKSSSIFLMNWSLIDDFS